ncbi:MAG: hypothetical protein GY811_05570 [Myxococcales bacterium]|nr:hypothetical protein [Myxococcales bacterium]
MSQAPSVLVLTSSGSIPGVVTAVLAALQAGGVALRAYDGGHVGSEGGGAIDWVMRTIGGDVLEHQLGREVESFRPDALVCFEANAARVACELRDGSARPFPVLAVIQDLAPSASWAQSEADRYFVVDDEAAVQLEDHGVAGGRILPVGCIGEIDYAQAGALNRKTLKKRFGLEDRVVLVEVEGLGAEQSGQLALQLSLLSGDITYLFDAGDDTDAAAALRVQVPILDMKAKLFGRTADAPFLWRCADAVVTRANGMSLGRAIAVGAKVVCLSPSTGAETHLANALEERGRGAIASNALMVGSALERLLANATVPEKAAGIDGAAVVADAAYLVASQRQDIIHERQAAQSAGRKSEVEDAGQFAAWAAKAATPAGALEDLGGGDASGSAGRAEAAPKRPDAARLRRLRLEIEERKAQVARTIGDAQKETASWDQERSKAESLGNAGLAKKAERNGDLERARMHNALAEMAGLQAEEASLDGAARAAAAVPPSAQPASPARNRKGSGTSANRKASARPSVAEELDRLRRQAEKSPAKKKTASAKRKTAKKKPKKKSKKGAAVDDELAALKRKMARKRGGR